MSNSEPTDGGANVAVSDLFGKSLGDAFRILVVDDPEIVRLGGLVLQHDQRNAALFREGQYPKLTLSYRWAIDLTTRQLAFDMTRPAVLFAGDHHPPPSSAVQGVATAIVGRLQTLRNWLVEGHIEAFGTFASTGQFGPIHRRQWARADLEIDIKSGDLLERIDHRAVPRWTGVILEAPPSSNEKEDRTKQASVEGQANEQFHVKHPVSHGARSNTTVEQEVQPSRGSSRVRATIRSRRQCQKWLEDMMRASPEERTASNDELWGMAQQQWPDSLSRRAFDKAKADAIASANAPAWAASGRPRKK